MNSESLVTSVTTVALALVGVAIIAVILSGRSQTTNVVNALGSSFSGAIAAAQSPVSGSGLSAVL